MLKRSRLFLSSLVITVGLVYCSASVYAIKVPCTASTSHSVTVGCHRGGHGCTMSILSEISGKSVEEISKLYPQKTAWQVAKSMGKLDDLKKAYLSHARVCIDRLVYDKKISTDGGTKMYADIQKRVAAIDGVNTVITGRPNYKPQFSSSGS